MRIVIYADPHIHQFLANWAPDHRIGLTVCRKRFAWGQVLDGIGKRTLRCSDCWRIG